MALHDYLQNVLHHADAQHARRRRRIMESAPDARVLVNGQWVDNFCSNDYLGLANHPEIKRAFIRGIEQWGSGSGASHLVTGHSVEHEALEAELAAFTGREAALLFSTGFAANTGTLTALLREQDVVLEDKLNHASLIDGGLFSSAHFKRYLHGDIASLSRLLQDHRREDGHRLVVTDSVFSMDGDIAPLNQIATICAEHDAAMMVDDAHGFGVLGRDGRGSLDACGLTQNDVPILMCTLGKSVGTSGAFVAGSRDLIAVLIQTSRPYIYSTAMPAALAAATRCALRLMQKENERREKLQTLITLFCTQATCANLPLMPSKTAIQPLLLGSNERAMRVSDALLKRGMLVSAIRPPTVPKGSARLRITLTAAHDEKTVMNLVEHLAELLQHFSEQA